MKKLPAAQAISAYIMLIGITCATLRIPIYVSTVIFLIGCAWAIKLSQREEALLRYALFACIPIIAVFIHVPLPNSLPGLIRLAITFAFWIAVLLATSYLVLGHKKSKGQRSRI